MQKLPEAPDWKKSDAWGKNKGTVVTYWPSAEPSIKRCTCVNKQKNSGSRFTLDNYITRRTDGLSQLESVGDQMPNWEPAADRGLWALSDPWLSNPSQDEKEVLLWSEELGSICCSLSPSPTHLSHTTNIDLFENKVWEIYFYKEVCSFVHWSLTLCLIMLHIHLYMYYVYVCGYTTPSRKKKGSRSFSVVTGEVKTFKSFLLLVEGLTCPFLCGTLVNLSTRSSRFCYQQSTNKTPYNGLSKIQLKTPNNCIIIP